MIRSILRGVVALGAAAVMVATAAPASATVTRWERMGCSSGAIDATASTSASIRLDGHLDCASGATPATFGVATYGPDGNGVYRNTLRPYGAQAPTAFSFGNRVADGYRQFALCVVTDYNVRIGCVQVSVGEESEPIVVVPLATDDPQVNMVNQRLIRSGLSSDPACGGCW